MAVVLVDCIHSVPSSFDDFSKEIFSTENKSIVKPLKVNLRTVHPTTESPAPKLSTNRASETTILSWWEAKSFLGTLKINHPY